MGRLGVVAGGVAALVMALAGPAPEAAANPASEAEACDRACQGQVLDQFLKAVVAQDPSKAPLAIGFRQTQNAVLTPAGQGVWKTITELGPADRRYFDPVTGNAEFFGTVMDRGERAVASVRIRIRNRQVTEAEWHIAHRGDPGISGKGSEVLFDVDNLIANQPPQRTVPAAERLPRETLIAIVNTYFDALANGNGRSVLAHGGCTRSENGFEVSGRPIRGDDPNDGHQGKGDCTSGYASLNVALVAARRYLLVDEEAQTVVMSAVFIRKPGDPRRRNHFMEVFGVDGGRIRSVHAAMFYGPPDLPLPNWPPYEGNFPLVVDPNPTQ